MRLIDADELLTHIEDYGEGQSRLDLIDPYYVRNAPPVEAIPKDQYETRLKADLEAILVELQLEIEEKEQYYQDKFLESRNAVHDAAMGGRMFGCGDCKEIIQQKINELRGK